MDNFIERTPLDAFLPFVMAAARGLPETMAIAYIRQACIEFCRRSNAVRRHVRLDQQRHVVDYPIWPDDSEQVVRVTEVRVGTSTYRARRDHLEFAHWGVRYTVRDGLVHLSARPQKDVPDAIDIRFVVAPTQTACEVDSILYHDWQNAIEDGALARIYQLPGYEFTEPRLATSRGTSFDERIARARVQALKSDTTATTVALAPRFV
jgi:hypothetical protein